MKRTAFFLAGVIIIILGVLLYDYKFAEPEIVKDFNAGAYQTFSTRTHRNNHNLDVSFNYPSGMGFKEIQSDADNRTGIDLELEDDFFTRNLGFLIFTPSEEYFNLPEAERKYYIHRNMKSDDELKALKVEKNMWDDIPVQYRVETIRNELLAFSYMFIYKDRFIDLIYIVLQTSDKKAYDLKEEEAIFKAICKTLKIQTID